MNRQELTVKFPVGSSVLNFDYTAKVIGYHGQSSDEQSLILEGVCGNLDVDKWIADPQKTIVLSKNSLGLSGKYEYFFIKDDLYRALTTNYIDNNGYRSGARFQISRHLVDIEYLTMIGL